MIDINFGIIDVNRCVIHHIKEKENKQAHATVLLEDKLIDINESIKSTIQDRLTSAAGKDSRSFELEIANYLQGSFFDTVKNLKDVNDDEFLKKSRHIAELLAESQTRNNISSGVFMLLDCSDKKTNRGIYVVIKAEFQEALRSKTSVDGENKSLELLKDIFLSPAQKLYKVGIIFDKLKPIVNDELNSKYGAIVFDEQFRLEGLRPAEYFYKDFLGLSISNNAKIQTANMYTMTKSFVITEMDASKRFDVLEALRSEIFTSTATTIRPTEFSKKFFSEYLSDNILMDKYNAKVANQLPSTITIDKALIQKQLEKTKMIFPNSIILAGDSSDFNGSVSIYENINAIPQDFNEQEFTIVIIKGKPFTNG